MNTLFKWTIKRKVTNLVSDEQEQSSPGPTEVAGEVTNSIKEGCQSAYEKVKSGWKSLATRNQCMDRWCDEPKVKSSNYCKYHKCIYPYCDHPRDRNHLRADGHRNYQYCLKHAYNDT